MIKLTKVVTSILIIVLIGACKDHQDLELKDIKHPDQDTIFFNLYSNVYSEDKTPQPIRLGDCLVEGCDGEGVVINVPRVYFHSTIRALDNRSFISKQFRDVPRNNWPKVSTTESLELLFSCEGDECVSYPETCDMSKLKCAKPLRTSMTGALPNYLNLARVKFLFGEQKRPFSIINPRFIWLKDNLIETLAGGYKRYETSYQLKKDGGGIYLPASLSDEFTQIQCKANRSYCEYLFYLTLDENFADKLYKNRTKKLLVKAEFNNIHQLKYDFSEVNKRLSKIKQKLCQFVSCKIE